MDVTNETAAPKRRRWLRVLLVVGILGLLGIGGFAAMLWSWTDVARVEPATAEEAFADALRRSGGGPAYLEIPEQGAMRIRHELEGERKTRILGLHAVIWQADRSRLVRLDVPGWFVRTKMKASFGLEALGREAGLDWTASHEVRSEDLARFGHGLVMDHRFGAGNRLLIWQEAEARP